MEFSRWNVEEHVKQRYLQNISSIGVDRALIEGKLTLRTRQPDCLPPVESIDLLFYLVLETSFYAQQQFKAFRSLQAYNQMVSGFIASVQGHILADKFVVLAKVCSAVQCSACSAVQCSAVQCSAVRQ